MQAELRSSEVIYYVYQRFTFDVSKARNGEYTVAVGRKPKNCGLTSLLLTFYIFHSFILKIT